MNQRFDDFVTGITLCYKSIQRIKTSEVTGLGLKGAHVMCLFHLGRHPEGLTAGALANLCAEDKAAISRTIAYLRSQALLASEDVHAYRARLFLTPRGAELAQSLDPLIAGWVAIGGEGITEEQRQTFYQVLDIIATNLRTRLDQHPQPTNI